MQLVHRLLLDAGGRKLSEPRVDAGARPGARVHAARRVGGLVAGADKHRLPVDAVAASYFARLPPVPEVDVSVIETLAVALERPSVTV